MAADFDVDAYLDESYEKKVKGEKEKAQEKTIPAESAAAKVDPEKSSDKDKKKGDGEKSPQKKSKKKRKSRSRERERGRRDRGRDRDRDRKKRRKRSKSRSRSRKRRKKRSSSSGSRDRRRKKSRTPSPTPEEIKEKEKQQELMELTRDVRTVFVSQLQVKCTEKDVKRFFEKVGKVKVNDVQLICDKHTGRSKGFGYVELKALEDVPKALVLNGQPFRFRKGKLGFPVMIKASEAEKNFAHNAEKATAAADDGSTATGAVTLQVANLHPEITEEDLGKMFTPFTNFTKAQLQRDAANKPTGRALVYFSQADAANRAIQGLNGVAFAGQTLQVRIVQAGSAKANDTAETWKLDDDAGTSGMSMNSASRAQLMQKLARGQALPGIPSMPPAPNPAATGSNNAPLGRPRSQGPVGTPSSCMVLKNMFQPETETDDGWDREIEQDIKQECSKYGVVQHIFADKNSQGFVYMKFSSAASGQAAGDALHGRWFNRKAIAVQYFPENVYARKFPDARA